RRAASCRKLCETDGVCKKNSIAGCGGIIRGNQGEWLEGLAKGVGMCSAFVRNCGESIVVVNAIKNGRASSSTRNSLVKQIRRLLELD
ncbi:hypothetical protein L195_g031034, partial [Trifolium pratense]